MYFEVLGKSDRIILFLHGWGGSTASFEVEACVLSKKFQTINLDFPSFGKSALPPRAYCVEDFAREVKRLLDEIGVRKCCVVGHSFGGRVAIKLARIYPELVEKIVLVDSAGIIPRRSIFCKMRIFFFKMLKKLVKFGIFKEKWLARFGSSDYKKLSPVMKESFVKIVNEDLLPDIKTIKVPTLIVWGKRDRETPKFMAKKILKNIRGSEIVWLSGGHFAYLENRNLFVNILYNFFEG